MEIVADGLASPPRLPDRLVVARRSRVPRRFHDFGAIAIKAIISGASVHAQDPRIGHQLRAPPPAPDLHDPQPGPFLIRVSGDAIAADDLPILSYAARQWTGEGYGAFSLCYRAGTSQRGASVPYKALRATAAELRRNGAMTIVSPNGWMCERPYTSGRVAVAHIEIMGTIAL